MGPEIKAYNQTERQNLISCRFMCQIKAISIDLSVTVNVHNHNIYFYQVTIKEKQQEMSFLEVNPHKLCFTGSYAVQQKLFLSQSKTIFFSLNFKEKIQDNSLQFSNCREFCRAETCIIVLSDSFYDTFRTPGVQLLISLQLPPLTRSTVPFANLKNFQPVPLARYASDPDLSCQ